MSEPTGPEARAAPGPVSFSPVAIVHGLPHVKTAIEAARKTGLQELTLVTARGAPDVAGASWCAELERLARQAAEGLAITFVTDCADAPGRALEALACGAGCIAVDAADEVFVRIEAIAQGLGARVLRRAPKGIDCALTENPARTLAEAWRKPP